ncbi:hypothetical protein DFJ77DRAFT_291075 [Powellomyces hirtus]|nr:hypothetical protein DFJ77DRAFT_291075 [Powellomyces hirtus]
MASTLSPVIKPCKCGSESHRRVTAKGCPLNPKNADSADSLDKNKKLKTVSESSRTVITFSSTPSLGGLPTELKWKLAQDLQPLDIARLATCSRPWREAARNKALWEHLLENGQGDDEDTRMVATTAKTVYYLTENDLNTLECTRVPNPHYRSAPSMRLYDKFSIQCLAFAKHGGLTGVVAKKEKAEERSRKTAQTQKANLVARREQLRDGLAKVNLKARSDSRLQEMFMRGGKDAPTLETVVETAVRMHIIHQHSNYSDLLDKTYEDIREEARRYGGFSDLWEENKETQEAKAMQSYEKVKLAYEKLPKDEQKAEICSCGRPLLSV